jgi:hypothetical protein
MRHVGQLVALVLGVTFLTLVPVSAIAQEQWLTPKFGDLQLRSDFRETYYPTERVREQGTSLRILEERFGLSFPIWQNSSDELSFTGERTLPGP